MQLPVLSTDRSIAQAVQRYLADIGWRCHAVERVEDLRTFVAAHCPAAALIDGRSPHAAAAIAGVRGLPAPASGTPLITLGAADRAGALASRHLELPLDAQELRTVLRHWAGPLDDHALRAIPFSPRYRLIRLVGFEAAEAMLQRFAAELEATLRAGAARPDLAHRLAGLAGMMGFAELGALWSAAEHGGAADLERALAASQEVLERRASGQ